MNRVSALMLFLLLLCACATVETRAMKIKPGPPMPSAIDENVARITGETYVFAIKYENAAGCTLDFCSEFTASKFGPGVTIPPEGQILLDLGKDGAIGFIIFEYQGEKITTLHVWENSHRAELKPDFKPALTAGLYFSPCQFVYHNNRYTIWWEPKK